MDGGKHVAPAAPERRGNGLRPERRLVLIAAVFAVLVAVLAAVAATRDADDASSVRAGAGTTSTSATLGSSGPAGPTGTSVPAPSVSADLPSSTTAKPRSGPKAKAISLVFAGDLLPHGPVNNRAAEYGRASGAAFDYAPMLAPMRPIVSGADVAICHFEVPVAPAGEPITSYPAFGAPAELVDGAKSAGYDGCSNASNHSLDRGRAGIEATLDRFDRDGLRHAGTARTAEEGATTTVYDVKGVKVAHLSYAYGFNGYPIPGDAPFAVNQISPARIKADAARARAEGADLVVVSVHWGTEYHAEPDQYQRDIAAQILPSADIDLVIGCHAHVVQPIGQVGGTYVVWGMGNQLSNMTQPERRDGLTVRATAGRGADGRWKVSGIEAIPTWVEPGSFRVLPVADTLADRNTAPGLRAELSASYDRSAAVIATQPTPGVVIAPKP